jgi:AraC family ethanolamine operon transcriptional activator
LVQLTETEFRSSQTVIELDGIKLLSLFVNQSIVVRSRLPARRYVATLFDTAHGGHFAGERIDARRVFVMPPTFDFDSCINDGAFSSSSIFVPPEQLEPYYQTLFGDALEHRAIMHSAMVDLESSYWVASWPDFIRQFNSHGLEAEQRLKIQGALRDRALMLVAYSIHRSIVEEYPEIEISEKSKGLAKSRALVRVAEDYSKERPEEHLRMVDLCEATQVSERTLQYAFKKCLGISPMNYLKRHRLHQVRHRLKQCRAEETTVTSVACQFGFFHFGDFSQSYKTQFGELPSETLRQIG